MIHENLEKIEIPEELDQVVYKAIQRGSASNERVIKMRKWSRNLLTSVAALTIGFVGICNISPTFADTISTIPGLGVLVKVITFDQIKYQEDTYEATLNTPIVEGLNNGALQEALNNKYIEENKALFEQFEKDVAHMKTYPEGGHLGIDTGYQIKTDSEQILSIGRYVVNTAASSSTTMTYDTIDKQNEILITLPSLFKDSSYIELISENIKEQMRTRMAQDNSLIYWIEGDPDAIDGFNKISANQNFYITTEGKLMISFDKYEVGPGVMGIQEFEIPTTVLQNILVSNTYIK
ncbi:DUF3298 domain-containing protein [Niameybacter massiliensis]|uniref:DUF3298 domain-containing protein n=2 Tax=Holtiella tumoricola TaxID=3018743 RepID=A0AA42J1S9_9FIRM|nr:DUF3298 and DUF4163 domain-containing protein [Holtiella tumoricola]MDA3732710.1 DUF3298 domain-containing protein [Holtiella tumoricola]